MDSKRIGAYRVEAVEKLESRLMLAVTATEYSALRALYEEFGLPADMGQINVIEVPAEQITPAALKAAVASAAASPESDLIVVRTTEDSHTIRYTAATDQLQIDVPASQGSVTLVGYGPMALTLDAAKLSTVVSVSPGDVNLGGMVVTGGNTTGSGGGIFTYGDLVLKNVRVERNVAKMWGGGIAQLWGTLTVLDSVIEANELRSSFLGLGGGIYHCVPLRMQNVTVSNNQIIYFGSDAYGAGIYQDRTSSELIDVLVTGNAANAPQSPAAGGGIYQLGGTLTARRTSIVGNSVTSGIVSQGGAIYTTGATSFIDVVIAGNVSEGSSVATGGGIWSGTPTAGASLELSNVLVVDNHARSAMSTWSFTGGMYVGMPTRMINVTITGNTAANNGGVLIGVLGVEISNSLIAGNMATQYSDLRASGTAAALIGSHNLIGDGSGQTAFVNGTNGNLVGTTIARMSPGFVSMVGDDWEQWDLRLRSDSPAVNGGDNDAVPAGVTRDLAGALRIADGVVDMGAFEFGSLPQVFENAGVMRVGVLSATQFGMTGEVTCVLVSGQTLFEIRDGGELWTTGGLDFESASRHVLRIRATDVVGSTAEADVTVGVLNVNETPAITGFSQTVAEDGVLVIDPGAQALFADPDGDAMVSIKVLGLPAHGVLRLSGVDVTVEQVIAAADLDLLIYTPDANYFGADSIQWTASDGEFFAETPAMINITVSPVNDAPVAPDLALDTDEDTAVPSTVAVAVDVENSTLTYSVVTAAEHGAVVMNADGSFTYTPDANYNGPDSFTFKANDGQVDSNTATVNITVAAVNDAPVATGQTLSTNEDTRISGYVSATDAEGDALTYILVSQPQHGSLIFETDGTFTYTPFQGYSGPDSLSFKANDGAADSNTATVSITVAAVNHAPAGISLSNATIAENLPAGSIIGDIYGTDPDGDGLSFSLPAGMGDNGLFQIVGDQLRTGAVCNYEATKTYSVTVRASDGSLHLDKLFTVSVTNVNETPTAISLSKSTVAEGAGANATVAALSAIDPDANSTFTYSLVSGSGWADNSKFIIDGNTLKARSSFDYETKSSYTLRVRVTDAGGLFYEKAFAIRVTNGAETAMVLDGTAGNDMLAVTMSGTRLRVTRNGTLISERESALVSQVNINGLAGNDTISLAANVSVPSLIYGGDGNDTITGGASSDTVYGNFGDDVIRGGAGNDSILAGLGADWIDGQSGNDRIWGGDQSDTLYGGAGNDYIEGKGKSDTLYGGDGNDTILGQAGDDLIYGQAGDDVIYVHDGANPVFHDRVYAGAGTDAVSYDILDKVYEKEVDLLA